MIIPSKIFYFRQKFNTLPLDLSSTRPDPYLIFDALRESLERRALPPDFWHVSQPAVQCPLELPTVVREHLEVRGIRPFIKTSGKKGVHIVVPLARGYPFSAVRDFAHGIGKDIARDTPRVVSEFPRSRDKGTVFIDYLQNAHGKTMTAPYSLRATPNATVSTPVRWEELRHGIRSEDFNIKTVISRDKDPWRDIFEDRQKLR